MWSLFTALSNARRTWGAPPLIARLVIVSDRNASPGTGSGAPSRRTVRAAAWTPLAMVAAVEYETTRVAWKAPVSQAPRTPTISSSRRAR